MLGRLFDLAYLALVATVLCLSAVGQWLLLGFHALFPFPRVLDGLYRRSRPLQRLFKFNLGMRTAGIEGRKTARELAETEEFIVEEHHTMTSDGFVLVLLRVLDPNRDCEALLCGGRKHALGLRLAAAGFDVFLGNARGNRYSHKHVRLSPISSDAYWSYSIDELARYDTPAMIDHVLKVTGQPQLCYVGFSQGTAQAFAALSSCPDLQDKVYLFVALSPAVRANHLSASMLLSLVQANLRFIYVLFGRRRMLPVAIVWQRIMRNEVFVATINCAIGYLFSWTAAQISSARKYEIYPYIYSYSSVKCVVHWFQMMYSGRLSMFVDVPASQQYVPVVYDVSKVRCPVALVYGGSDHLVDVESLKDMLPNVVMSQRVEGYEHLDVMWADTAKDIVFPKVECLIQRLWLARGVTEDSQRASVATLYGGNGRPSLRSDAAD